MPGYLNSSARNGGDAERASLMSNVDEPKPSPQTLTKLVRRLRALTLALLPLEVEPSEINVPTSRVITPQVIAAYRAAAGDFQDALPYCLLRARAEFMWDANHNYADYDENVARAVACEVLARRIVHIVEPDRLGPIMARRYQHVQIDGDISEMSSTLELAIDQHCTIFLSSTEAQDVVNDLWRGDLVQKNMANGDVDYIRYSDNVEHSFWGHLDISRLSVPRYQNMFRIVIWLFFLVVYSQAVREPLEKAQDQHWDGWEVILYFMSLSFIIEDTHKFFSLLKFVTWRAFTFWNFVSFVTDSLLTAAFIFRVMSVYGDGDHQTLFKLRSFQVLSFVAPLIWMKLVTVFDGYKYIGTMQICVARMLKESGIFFALLSVLALGFTQGLYALDAADGAAESVSEVVNLLVQALLQAPDYQRYSASPTGLTLYYLWSAVTAIVLLNVLISLFSSAYADVVEDAEAQYLAFFASKTIGMIRAPDSFVYPAPFNIIETFFIAPFEFFPIIHLSKKNYAKLNRYVMGMLFFIPLTIIAVYESALDPTKNGWMNNWFRGNDEGADDSPEYRNPTVDDPALEGKQISRVPFEELVKVFPNTAQSSEATILKEIDSLKQQIEALTKLIQEKQ
ncbi:calcium activated cation channel [Coprinopsis cinerea AmutBmut pab1-1]|nr:calcium activated cation channel [Coprinopsis cinerea AmutBmut pab1-1]